MHKFPGICNHVAVCTENHIIVFGGSNDKASLHNIWLYNVYTEQWGKHVIPGGEVAPPRTQDFCAVVIEGDV